MRLRCLLYFSFNEKNQHTKKNPGKFTQSRTPGNLAKNQGFSIRFLFSMFDCPPIHPSLHLNMFFMVKNLASSTIVFVPISSEPSIYGGFLYLAMMGSLTLRLAQANLPLDNSTGPRLQVLKFHHINAAIATNQQYHTIEPKHNQE